MILVDTNVESSINPASFDAAIERMARSVHRLAPWRMDLDDLIQIGRVALLECAARWRTVEHRSGFWPYAYKRVFGSMRNAMYNARRSFLLAPGEEDYLVEPHNEPHDDRPRPDSVYEARERLNTLSSLDREILERAMAGEEFREIAAHTGVPRSTAHRRYTAAVEAIQAYA